VDVKCPNGCGGNVVVIETRGASDSEVTLTSCSYCDRRWWTCDGSPADLRSLLEDLAFRRVG
jgi:hypothetical protein